MNVLCIFLQITLLPSELTTIPLSSSQIPQLFFSFLPKILVFLPHATPEHPLTNFTFSYSYLHTPSHQRLKTSHTFIRSHCRLQATPSPRSAQHSPEHLNSWSCRSATFCPLSCVGEKQRVYRARRGKRLSQRASQDRWQSQIRLLSDRRSVRSRNNSSNRFSGSDVKLLLFSVLRSKMLESLICRGKY